MAGCKSEHSRHLVEGFQVKVIQAREDRCVSKWRNFTVKHCGCGWTMGHPSGFDVFPIKTYENLHFTSGNQPLPPMFDAPIGVGELQLIPIFHYFPITSSHRWYHWYPTSSMQAARFSGWWRTEAIEYQIGVGEGSGERQPFLRVVIVSVGISLYSSPWDMCNQLYTMCVYNYIYIYICVRVVILNTNH